ncbi:MAG: 16S rRNA (guanine(966)-N(2))-methyltransferase RsmD [Candidatus Cloacimonadota bacterium]|nr:MAG: 16S rRNA (guanine(966)-N(2))-methyltransferase RsmD [Candidatus Cloacimonadota bacterium]
MRIIAGIYKRHKLKMDKHLSIRPTADSVRESLFAVIQDYVKGAIVLDLFAGTGSFGLEALSRGAKEVHFVDKSYKVSRLIEKNIEILQVKQWTKLFRQSADKYLTSFPDKKFYNIIFIDPPYNKGIVQKVVGKIFVSDILKDDGILVVEHSNRERLQDIDNRIIIEKNYGDTNITILTQ